MGRPLFVPLKSEYFDAFERGEKTEELRLYGPRWNERTCAVGRRVVLSRGYGKHRRLNGTIWKFKCQHGATFGSAYRASVESIYGTLDVSIACISISLDVEVCLGCRKPTALRDCGCPAGTAMEAAPRPITANNDAKWLRLWRAVSGPHAELTGPLIRFAALVASQASGAVSTEDFAVDPHAAERPLKALRAHDLPPSGLPPVDAQAQEVKR